MTTVQAWTVTAMMAGVANKGCCTIQAQENPNRLAVSYLAGFNIKADFSNIGHPSGYPASANGVSYSNGFSGVDSTGNAGGLTTYWGFQSSSQAVHDSLLLKASGNGRLGTDSGNDFNHGTEILYGRRLGKVAASNWGLEGSFGFTDVDVHSDSLASPNVLRNDAYSLGGIVLPSAPYSGPQIAGAGVPLLSTSPVPISTTVRSAIDAQLYAFKIGPFVEVPLSAKCELTISGGFAFAIVDSKASSSELAYVGGAAYIPDVQSSTRSDTVYGGYISALVGYKITPRWEIFTGMQYRGMGAFDQAVADKAVRIHLAGAYFWSSGIQWNF